MRVGGKLFLAIVMAGLVLSGCQSVSKSDEAAPRPSGGASPSDPDAAPATSHSLAVPEPVKTSAGMVAELAPTKTAKFALLGVTWDRTDDEQDVAVEVRVRRDDGWSSWEALEVAEDGGDASRGGTEPWWVEDADEVGARVITATGSPPTGVKVITVDPGAGDTPGATTTPAFYSLDGTSTVVAAADGKPTFIQKPKIITRASWKAKKPIGCDEDGFSAYGETTLGVNMHHSAGSNSYSKSQSASIVRGVQKFHQSGRGWCDIAYNFLVDKYGQIFEGRAGGVDRPVRGSHSGNNTVNEQTMGVALMGNLDKAKPSTAMKNSTVKLVGWRLATYYKPAKGTIKIGGKSLNRISGHRNVVSTACPGKYGYSWIGAKGGLRDRVGSYVSSYKTAIRSAAWRLDKNTNTVTGPVTAGEYGNSGWHRTVFGKMIFYWIVGTPDAYYVSGAARSVHYQLGMQSGALGFPTGNMGATEIAGLSAQPFQRGHIYQVGAAAHGLHGAIDQTYVSAGGPGGDLGLPQSGIVVAGTTKTATFEHGTITQEGTDTPEVHLDAPARKAPSEPPPETATPTEPAPPTPSATEEGIEPSP